MLLRRSPLRRDGWLFFLLTTVYLSGSALFELVEWAAATAFGAVTAQLILGRLHDTQLARIGQGGGEAR